MTKQPLCDIRSGCFYGLCDLYQQLDRLTLVNDLTGFLINPQAVDFSVFDQRPAAAVDFLARQSQE